MPVRYIILFSILSVLVFGTHAYLYRRLVRDVTDSPRLRRIGRWLAVFMALGLFAGLLGARTLPRNLGVMAGFFSYTWMGMLMLLLPGLWAFDLYRGARHLTRKAPVDPSRRRALARGAAAVTAIGATATASLSVANALAPPDLERIDVPIKGLPAALDGFTIAQISDIHVGPTIGVELMRSLVDRINALSPDLVAVTGDLVDGTVARLGEHTAPLGDLKSRHGTYFVTGNHEYYSGANEWIAEMRRLGLTVLRNERVELDHDGAILDVLGTDDWRAKGFIEGHGHDLKKAAAGRDRTRTSLLLAHQPKAIHDAAKHEIDLMICGHTHGGQLFPANILVKLIQPYVRGLHAHTERTWIYVHKGSGYWGPPMRLAANAEIALLTLRRV